MRSSWTMAWMGILLVLAAVPVQARTEIEPGINAFSVQQDVELGREAAAEVERELRLLRDPQVTRYVDAIGQRLARVSRLPELPYTFKVVDSRDVNAFALPGGFVYVNRGIIEMAETESELAGVISHEIGHVAARHGTNQVTKQMLVSMPLALLGGSVLDGDGGTKEALARLGIQLGVGSVMMSYSRDAERQADLLAVQQLHDAGYEPAGMARFFQRLNDLEKREPSRIEQFFSSHPPPSDRFERVQREIATLGPLRSPVVSTREFERVKAGLGGRVASGRGDDARWGDDSRWGDQERRSERGRGDERRRGERRRDDGRGQGARRGLETYLARDGGFALSLPAGWLVTQESGDAVTITPPGGERGDGSVEEGLIVRRLQLRGFLSRASLDELADAYVRELLQRNSHLREVDSGRSEARVDGEPALRRVLRGRAPGTREDEIVAVTVIRSRNARSGLGFVAVAPEPRWRRMERVFDRVLSSLELRSADLRG